MSTYPYALARMRAVSPCKTSNTMHAQRSSVDFEHMRPAILNVYDNVVVTAIWCALMVGAQSNNMWQVTELPRKLR